MVYQKPPAPEQPKKKEGAPSSLDTRGGLDQLKEGVADKRHLSLQIQDLLKDFNTLLPNERKRRVGALLAAATPFLLSYLMEEKKGPAEQAEKKKKKKKKGKKKVARGAKAQSQGTEGAEADPKAKRRIVVCNDMRLICINTDPAKGLVPKELHGKSSYLLEYGLPEYETFKEEMLSILAPDASDEENGVTKVTDILKRAPMGKYQCMPQYLFKYVNLPYDKENGLEAMWRFLQDENLQREACRKYVQAAISSLRSDPRFNNDPRYVYAAYYGGENAAKKLMAVDAGEGTEKQQQDVSKKQGAYISIEKYAGKRGGGSLDVESIVSSIASRESGNLEGKISKARDAEWEKDQRYAYNREPKKDNPSQVA